MLISAPDPLYRNLREVIDMLDQRRAQVVIESLIVEVGEDDATEFGVQWQAGNLAGKGGFGGVNLGGSGLATTAKTSLDVLPKGLNVGVVNGTVDIPGIGKVLDLEVLARALKSKGGTNVLSTPNLLTLDNEAASIFVGQTIPFVTGELRHRWRHASNNPFQTVQREEVGLKLNVRPQISEGGTVKLDIYQEVSSVDTRTSVDAGTVTNKRAIDTGILLDDGQIMVLGGLLQDGYSQSNDAVPWLADIPGLGALFRNEKRSVSKTNLMVFLRPYIIRDSGAGRSITLNRYEFMRRAQGGLQPEHSWAMPDVQAPQLPSVEKAIPGQQGPRAVIRAVPVGTQPMSLLPYAWAKSQRILLRPGEEGMLLTVCPSTPGWSISEVQRQFGQARVEQVRDDELDGLLTGAYADTGSAAAVVGAAENEVDLDRLMQDMPEITDLLDTQDGAPVIRMINALLTQAARDEASDIHIEPYETHSVVRYRVDGTLRDVVSPRKALHGALVSRIKIMAQLDIAEKRLPQDGRIALRVAGRPIDIRVSTVPTGHGERVVMRLLDKQAGRLQLETLGMAPALLARLDTLIRQPTASCWSPALPAAAKPPACTPPWRGWMRAPAIS